MDLALQLFDFIMHIDKHLAMYSAQYGVWLYGILFLIIFSETGFVVTPFLPGDSLLFAAGALCPSGALQFWVLTVLLILAAFLGNMVNFFVGRALGPNILEKEKIPFVKKEYILKATAFYEKHGTKAVVLSRFVPIVRTFVPFVAGIANMNRGKYTWWTFASALLWVLPICGAGVLFGELPIVKNNFSLVVLFIIFLSILPGIITFLKGRSDHSSH